MARTLYYGDNLDILRDMQSESIDLIYLDPPFNSNADYNVIFREQSSEGNAAAAQIHAFEDTWQWGEEAARTLAELVQVNGHLAEYLSFTVGRLGHNSMSAYLVMMAPRLEELRRVLKPTGSLYLHCDPTAGHYLKVLLDVIFGPRNFRNEITWKRTFAHGNVGTNYGSIADAIFWYSKTDDYTWNQPFSQLDEARIEAKYPSVDPDGRRWQSVTLRNPSPRPNLHFPYTASNGVTYQPHPNGWVCNLERLQKLDKEGRLHFPKKVDGALRLKMYADESPGERVQNIWTDIPPIAANARERLGYPTQKPVALLERIVQASSSPGDVVLDPFCGCGTAIAAAENLGRSWIGIDITHLAVSLIEARLRRDFGLESGKDYALEGTPKDLASARFLFEHERDGPYQFQFWVVGLIGAQPYGAGVSGKGKKGGDSGIDGMLYFLTPGGERVEKVVVSVKGGKSLNPSMIRDLESVVRREKAAMGVFVTLETPTAGMYQEAAKHGFYWYGKDCYPAIQLLTVEELLDGKRPQMPSGAANVSLEGKQAKSVKSEGKRRNMPGLFDSSN